MFTKQELINKMRNPDNKKVLQAVEELRVRGWLNDGSLRGAAFIRVQLQGADLIEANLSFIDFHQADMEFVDLSGADLRGAKLTRANLIGANMSEADLTRANLYKTNLRACRNLTDNQLAKARSLWGAIMPDGGSYDGRYNLPGDIELARYRNVVKNDNQAMADFYGVSLDAYLNGQGERVAQVEE